MCGCPRPQKRPSVAAARVLSEAMFNTRSFPLFRFPAFRFNLCSLVPSLFNNLRPVVASPIVSWAVVPPSDT